MKRGMHKLLIMDIHNERANKKWPCKAGPGFETSRPF